MTNPLLPFPFIVGCGRSGTTLLRAMLDSNPDLAVPPESHFIPSLAPRKTHGAGAAFDVPRFLEQLRASDRFRRWVIPDELLTATMLADPRPVDVPEALRRAYGLYASLQGKPRYGDKTPGYVERLPLLGDLFPEARFVHLIRDGRDVALSFVDAPFGPTTLLEAATLWRRRVLRGLIDGATLGSDRYREVRYEELVSEPERVLVDLCRFLRLPFETAMLQYHERADAVLAGVRATTQHQRLAMPPTQGLRDWRTQLDPDDMAMIEGEVGGLLADLGYELVTPAASRHSRWARAGRTSSAWGLSRSLKARRGRDG